MVRTTESVVLLNREPVVVSLLDVARAGGIGTDMWGFRDFAFRLQEFGNWCMASELRAWFTASLLDEGNVLAVDMLTGLETFPEDARIIFSPKNASLAPEDEADGLLGTMTLFGSRARPAEVTSADVVAELEANALRLRRDGPPYHAHTARIGGRFVGVRLFNGRESTVTDDLIRIASLNRGGYSFIEYLEREHDIIIKIECASAALASVVHKFIHARMCNRCAKKAVLRENAAWAISEFERLFNTLSNDES